MKLTQKYLKDNFLYIPESGAFVRRTIQHPNQRPYPSLSPTGSLVLRIGNVLYQVHRLIFLYQEGKFPEKGVDHINGLRGDNRWCNLRPADQSQNGANRAVPSNNKSGYPGVSYIKKANKWLARITWRGKTINIGRYQRKEDAITARKEMEAKYFGQYSRVCSRP